MMKTWKLVMVTLCFLIFFCVLNTKVWPKLQKGSKDDENLLLQLNSVKKLLIIWKCSTQFVIIH